MRLLYIIFIIILSTPCYITSKDGLHQKIKHKLSDLGYVKIKLYKNEFDMFELPARINNKEIRLLLTPHKYITIFNKRYIDLLGLDYYDTKIEVNYGGDTDFLSITTVDSLVIGSVVIRSFDVKTVEFMNFAVFSDLFVEGMIGKEFLIKYNAIIDYGNEFLYLKGET